ncbi:MAG: methylenetetrahydrofolate reductase [Ruminococcus sp.]|nr:methylenetetrahydrofolate reductase [NAD(P)H] [Ruminococcus sp.]
MKLDNLFRDKTVFSFEIFPPKPTSPLSSVESAIESLSALSPDFISVTYGAGGSKNGGATTKIAADLKKKYNVESVVHLTCLYHTKEEVRQLLEIYRENGIDNILALRGDRIPDAEPCGEFSHASELVEFIKANGDFHVVAACYPEVHNESSDSVADMKNLKYKVDCGADHLVSQLFLDNEYFYSFREKALIAGIDVPIEAGIMPVTNKKQIERMVSMCGIHLPKKFARVLDRFGDDPEAMRDAGIAYAVDQIVDLVSQGVDGIHLYTMNNPYVAEKIHSAVSSLFKR